MSKVRTCIGTGRKDYAKVVGTELYPGGVRICEGVSWEKRSWVVKCMNLEIEVLHSCSDSILEEWLGSNLK